MFFLCLCIRKIFHNHKACSRIFLIDTFCQLNPLGSYKPLLEPVRHWVTKNYAKKYWPNNPTLHVLCNRDHTYVLPNIEFLLRSTGLSGILWQLCLYCYSMLHFYHIICLKVWYLEDYRLLIVTGSVAWHLFYHDRLPTHCSMPIERYTTALTKRVMTLEFMHILFRDHFNFILSYLLLTLTLCVHLFF